MSSTRNKRQKTHDESEEVKNNSSLLPVEFMRWVEANGVYGPKLRVGKSIYGCLGLLCDQDIASNERYASIPLRMVLTCDIAVKSPVV